MYGQHDCYERGTLHQKQLLFIYYVTAASTTVLQLVLMYSVHAAVS